MWKGIYTSMANWAFLQLLLLHLGREKLLCSLMRKIYHQVFLTGWKKIKFALIWYIIHWILLQFWMKNLNLKKCLLSFFAECISKYTLYIWQGPTVHCRIQYGDDCNPYIIIHYYTLNQDCFDISLSQIRSCVASKTIFNLRSLTTADYIQSEQNGAE